MRDWHTQAICRDEDPDVFFPRSDDLIGRNAAIAICKPCPVRGECYAEASAAKGSHGVFGGVWFGPNEDASKVGRPRKPREHGTPTGYQQHIRRRDKICGPCREAMQPIWDRQNAGRPRRGRPPRAVSA